jgi:hypothetical protein
MNLLLVFLSLFFNFGFQNQGTQLVPIEKVRDQYFAIDRSKGAAEQLYKSLEKSDLSKNTVLMAYRGASSAAAAGSVRGVWNKLEYFNRGKNELEKAVKQNPTDAEVRFLRLATQLNAPGFLGYSGETVKDKSFIIQTLSHIDSDHANSYLYLRICRFLTAKANLNSTEKNVVNQLIEKFNPKR